MATENLEKAAKQESEELKEGYDKAMEEGESSMATVEILGKDFEIPAQMPGWLTFFIARHGQGDDKEVPAEKNLQLIKKLCGDEILEHVIMESPNDVTTEELTTDVMDKFQSVWEENTKKKNQ